MECFALNINYKAYNLIRCWVSVAVNLGSRHHTLLRQFGVRTPTDLVAIRTRQQTVIRSRHVHYDKVAVRLSNAGYLQILSTLDTERIIVIWAPRIVACQEALVVLLYYNVGGVEWSDVDIWFE